MNLNSSIIQKIPYFGEYQKLREEKIAEIKEQSDPLSVNVEASRPVPEPKGPVPKVKDIIGKSIPHIGTYKKMDNKKQVVALIDDVSTILIY